MNLTVIVPAYNEVNQITRLADTHRFAVSNELRLVVVDDGSTDGTAEAVRAFYPAAQVITIQHGGKARALLHGICNSPGDVFLLADFDGSTPITAALNLAANIGAGADLALGSRGLARPGAPLARRFISTSNYVARVLLLGRSMARIRDTQCGFKMVRASAAWDIVNHLYVYSPQHMNGVDGPDVQSGFDVEFIYAALRLGYSVVEVPVIWNHVRTARVNPFRDAARGLRDLLRIRAAWK